MKEALDHLSRSEFQKNILENIDREVKKMGVTSKFRWWWDHSVNWVKVQTIINGNTSKAGSTSSVQQCIFIGINPDSYSIYDPIKK